MRIKMNRIKYNGPVRKQKYLLDQIEELDGNLNNDENPEFFKLEDVCGTWYNNLYLSIMIYKDHAAYKVAFLHIQEGMVVPEISPIDNDSGGYYMINSYGKIRIYFDDMTGGIVLDSLGSFYRYK